jgi:type II secretory ATPase GspE/PulE/Tfp pilus assembly ATPase PilB-like protein
VHLGEGTFDVRVSIVPIAAGESIVLRLFNTGGIPIVLEDLGLDPRSLSLIRTLVSVPHGLVLATGPTGSGKTTTLNAVLRELASERVKIITIEDPVEYVIDGVDQIQTHDRIGLTFDTILRRVLRQDPDIIMVGEIRDAPTAELSVRAALTGHLVLSTLHTNDAVSVIPRLRNMGVEPYLLAAVLRGALAQRLVRRVCQACRKSVTPTREEKELLKRYGLTAARLFRGKGCDACGGTGFKGRTSIVEAFASDEEVEQMILKGERASAIAAHLAEKGFTSLVQNGLSKAVEGITTLDEVEKAVVS